MIFYKRRYFKAVTVFLSMVLCIVMMTCCSATHTLIEDAKDFSSSPVTQSINKTYFDERLPQSIETEHNGIVHKGYFLKYLRSNEFGWDIFTVCDVLGIKVVVLEDKYNIHKEWNIPINFYIEKGNVKLAFKGDVDSLHEIYIKTPYMAGINYKVIKNNKEIVLRDIPKNFKARGPCMDIYELLDALEIKYHTYKSTIYIDSDAQTPILGEIFSDSRIRLDSKQEVAFKLVNNYKSSNDRNYKSIELIVNGEKSVTIQRFDESDRGNTDYYYSGSIDYLNYNGEDFIQVNLGKDTNVYKYKDGELIPVLKKDSYQKYLNGNFTLETDENSKCTFIDKVNGVIKEVECKGAKPNSIYNVGISYFGRMEYDIQKDKFKLVANVGSITDGRYFFTAEIEFVYNGYTFIPAIIRSTNWAKFGEDKSNEKRIESMDEYRWFEYEVNNI